MLLPLDQLSATLSNLTCLHRRGLPLSPLIGSRLAPRQACLTKDTTNNGWSSQSGYNTGRTSRKQVDKQAKKDPAVPCLLS